MGNWGFLVVDSKGSQIL